VPVSHGFGTSSQPSRVTSQPGNKLESEDVAIESAADLNVL